MSHFTLDTPAVPFVAVCLGHSRLRALLHVPGQDTPYSLQLDSPEWLLEERIKEATAARRSFHLAASPVSIGAGVLRALQAHHDVGLEFSTTAELAPLLSACDAPAHDTGGLSSNEESRGDHPPLRGTGQSLTQKQIRFNILHVPAQDADIFQDSRYGPRFWAQYCRAAKLPEPQGFCVTLPGYGGPDSERPHSSALLRHALAGLGDSPLPLNGESLAKLAAEHSALGAQAPASGAPWGAKRFAAIAKATASSPQDWAAMTLLAFASMKEVAGRSQREGVVMCYAGAHSLLFSLLFQERLYGLLEVPFGSVFDKGFDAFLPLLEDFRLGWLPAEKAEGLGGAVACAGSLPSEAEGFKPLFVLGPKAEALKGRARILDDETQGRWLACLGLLKTVGNR